MDAEITVDDEIKVAVDMVMLDTVMIGAFKLEIVPEEVTFKVETVRLVNVSVVVTTFVNVAVEALKF